MNSSHFIKLTFISDWQTFISDWQPIKLARPIYIHRDSICSILQSSDGTTIISTNNGLTYTVQETSTQIFEKMTKFCE
jgi:hypothetical protein